MHTRRTRASGRLRRNALGQKVVDYINISAEAANVGILVQALGGWIPAFALFVAATPLSYLMLIGDPAIYFLRALIRLTKLIGKRFFKIEFEEEKHGPSHRWQTAGNLFTLCCFILAIALFTGALVAPPVGITLAWTAGLLGQTSVAYFDYIWPAKQARLKWEALQATPNASAKKIEEAHQEYLRARNSRRLFIGLLIGLSVLLICGSAAAFAPPLLVPILALASNLASLSLAIVAVSRFWNWCKHRHHRRVQAQLQRAKEPKPENEIEMQTFSQQGPSLSPSLAPLLQPELKLWEGANKPYSPSRPSRIGQFSPSSRSVSESKDIITPRTESAFPSLSAQCGV